MTQRQSNNQWSGGIAAHSTSKIPNKKKSSGKVFASVFWGQDNNALAHRALATQKKLACLGFQCLDHPPYSSDLSPPDYHLFPGLNKQLKGCHCKSDAEVIAAAETWLDGQRCKFFF